MFVVLAVTKGVAAGRLCHARYTRDAAAQHNAHVTVVAHVGLTRRTCSTRPDTRQPPNHHSPSAYPPRSLNTLTPLYSLLRSHSSLPRASDISWSTYTSTRCSNYHRSESRYQHGSPAETHSISEVCGELSAWTQAWCRFFRYVAQLSLTISSIDWIP